MKAKSRRMENSTTSGAEKPSLKRAKLSTAEEDSDSDVFLRPSAFSFVKDILLLSPQDITHDLRELTRQAARIASGDGSDSEDSIRSEDILPSSYPVKPRRRGEPPAYTSESHAAAAASAAAAAGAPVPVTVPQNTGRGRKATNNAVEEDADGPLLNPDEVEEALAVIQRIFRSNQDIHEAEIQYEDLEFAYEGYKQAHEFESKTFSEERSEHEAYFRLLQAILLRLLRIHSGYARQNLMFYRIYNALTKLKSRNVSLSKGLTALREARAKASQANLEVEGGEEVPREAGNLAVQIRIEGSERAVVIMVGDVLDSADGAIELTALHLEEKEVSYRPQNSDGPVQRMPLSNAVKLKIALEAECENGLLHSLNEYWSEIKDILHLTPQDHRELVAFMSSVNSEEDSTDHDEQSVGESDRPVEDSPVSGAPSDEEGEITEGGTDSSAAGGANGNKDSQGASDAGSTSSPAPETAQNDYRFPLKVTVPANITRGDIKETLTQEAVEYYGVLKTKNLPIAFTPLSSLPAVVDKLLEVNEEISPEAHGRINFDLTALADVPESCTLGTSGMLGWHGDVQAMRASLKALTEEVSALEEEQCRLIQQVSRTRWEGLRNTQKTSALRLSMFTRRVAHRNFLSSQGLLPAENTGVKEKSYRERLAPDADAPRNTTRVVRASRRG